MVARVFWLVAKALLLYISEGLPGGYCLLAIVKMVSVIVCQILKLLVI